MLGFRKVLHPVLLSIQQLGFPGGSVDNQSAVQETQVQSLGQEDPLEKEMATHSSIPAWGNPMDRRAWWATDHGVTKSRT